MGLSIETFPAKTEILALLTVAEMKENLRISYNKEDNLIERCILAAYDWLAGEQGWLNRSVLATTWKLTSPAFADRTELKRAAPALGVTSVKYLASGVQQTADSSIYGLYKTGPSGFAELYRRSGQAWPTGIDVNPESVEILYTAGLADGTGVEVRKKHMALHKAMALLAGDYFRNREDTFTDIRMVEIDRKIVNGVNRVAGRYRFMNNHA